MPLNTTIVSLNYRKFSGAIPSQNIEVTFTGKNGKHGSIDPGSFRVWSKPNWAKIILEEVVYINGTGGEIEKLIVKVAIDPVYADNLAIGYFQEKASIYYSYQLDGPNNNSYNIETFDINLRVTERQKLSLNGFIWRFNYTIGDPAPASQFLGINSGGNWSIVADRPWVNFSQDNGTGDVILTVTPDVTGMTSGVHVSQFFVDDGDSQVNGYIYVYVSGSGTEGDYLNTSPDVMQFSETYLQPSEKENTINIDSSLASTVTANVNWLVFSNPAPAAGITQVTVSTVDTELLQVGSYPAEIKITSDYSVRVIDVLLNVVEVTTAGITSNSFYFAEDRNTLLLTSGDDNTEILADFKTTATLELKRYRKRAPFNNNFAQLVIGLETALYLRPKALPPSFFTQGFVPVKPIKLDFSLYERSLTTAAMQERGTYENLQFLNGKTPEVANKLSNIPDTVTVPKDGIIAFSFKSEAVINEVVVTGAVTSNIPVYFDDTNIYGIFLDLSNFTLKETDALVVSCGPVSVNVVIKNTQLPTTQLIWLNEWDCPEVFNMDGITEVIKENESKTVFTNRNGKEYASIIDSKDPKTFKIGTGNIYSEEEAAHLAGVLSATKVWLQIGASRIEVIKKFRSLSISETRRYTNNFTLSFDAAEK